MALLQLLFLLVAIRAAQQVKADQPDNRSSLHLLNILPFPDRRPNTGWDRAYELIPAAQLAVDQINNASHILPGYKLNLVNVDTDACAVRYVSKGLVNTYAKVFIPENSLNVVGFTGLFCSRVTDAITSAFGGPNVAYLQLTGSTTPLHRRVKYPWLVHFLSSTTILHDAIVEIVREFGWTAVSVVFELRNIFQKSTADDLTRHAQEFNVTAALVPVVGNLKGVYVLSEVQSRIVFISTPDTDAANVMCKAYKRNAVYPGYVYFLIERSLPELLSRAAFTDCTFQQLMRALEGVFFLSYKLSNVKKDVNESEAELVSGMTYQDYKNQYLQYLEEMELVINTTLRKDNAYANVMYDQIWAFALTLGKSLDTLNAANINTGNLHLQQTNQFSSILRSGLENVSFEGASGSVEFNSEKEVSSVVEIFQVINGTSEPFGLYNPDDDKQLTLLLPLPPNDFKVRALLLPLWVSTFFNIYVFFWIFVTTFVVVFLYLFKHRPEVKASSPALSVAMFIGCYFLFISTLTRNITRGYAVTDFNIFTLLCNIEAWFGMIGLTLIFSALLMKLLRIRQIFKAHGKMSRFWKNKYMMLSILTICSGIVVLLILWTALDKIHIVTITTQQPRAIPPFFDRHSECSNNTVGIWVLIFLAYNGVLMLIIVFVAVQTRKIRLSNFKNTKKINIFLTLTCMTLSILAPLWYTITEDVLQHIITCFGLSCTGVYCQVTIFIPRVFITIINLKTGRKRGESGANRRECQFSTAEM